MVEVAASNAKQVLRRRPTVRRILLSPMCLISALLLVLSLILILNRTNYHGRPLKESIKEKLAKWRKQLRPGKPVTIESTLEVFRDFLQKFHDRMQDQKEGKTTYHQIWEIYHDLVVETLYPWDQHYLEHMPERRNDDSIFVSIASYRDENCLSTLHHAYSNAKHPEKLNVGLVQQNCVQDCKSGVLKDWVVKDVPPDDDCHALFCESPEGKPHCEAGRVRALHVNETESLGPYAARYFASKLWMGESWFLQIDSHMTFAQDWDATSVEMLQKAPSKKPILSHYPPGEHTNFELEKDSPAPRICGPVFAGSPIEDQIVRLEGAGSDRVKLGVPRIAGFVAAGYYVAHSAFLKEVPFDPFLPWIFMGEEIIMSARFWTHGYDIFSPIVSVVGHIYVRRHKPKFWETVSRLYWDGIHNPLSSLVLQRVKAQLLYPESSRDVVMPKSVFTGIERYTMGTKRSVKDYLDMVGLDPITKTLGNNRWCENGQPPDYYKHLAHLYETGEEQNDSKQQGDEEEDEEEEEEQDGDEDEKEVEENPGQDHQ